MMPTYHRTYSGHLGNWLTESTAWLREAYTISKPESLLFMDNVRPSLLRDLLAIRPVKFLVFRPYYAPSGMNMHNYAVGACRKLDEYLTQPLVRAHLDNGTLIVKFFNEPNIGYEGFPEGRDCLDQVHDLTLEAFRLAREHYPQVKYASPPPTPGHHDAWFAGGRDDYGHYYFHGPEGCKENPTPAEVQAAIQSCKLREVFESADIISYHVNANVAVGVNGDQATWYSKRHKQYQKFINHYDKPQWIFEADMGYDEAGQVAGLLAPPPALGHGRGMSLAPGGKDAARAESLIQPSFNQTIAHNRAVLSKWWYENVIDPDPRIEGVIHWWLCGPNEASPVWAKHFMYGAEGMHPIIHAMGSYGGVPDVPTPPPPEEEPDVSTTNLFIAALRSRFGSDFEDIRASLPKHRTLHYSRRAASQIEGYAIHHTGEATTRATTWLTVARYHVTNPPDGNGWPGIAYHVGIRLYNGKVMVSLLNDVETVSYHVGDANTTQLAICIMGDFRHYDPAAAEIAAARNAIAALDAVLGRRPPVRPHHYFRQTECPARWTAVLPTLRVPTPPPPEPEPRYSLVARQKAAYWGEETARRLRDGRMDPTLSEAVREEVHNLWLDVVLPRLYALRDEA